MRWPATGFIIAVLITQCALAQDSPNPFTGPGAPPPPGRFGHPFGGPPPMDSRQPTTDQSPHAVGSPIDRRQSFSHQVDQSIDLGVQYLLKHQRDDGSWKVGDAAQQDVGGTALVGLALLSCGVSHQSPEMVKALDYLKKAKIDSSYATYNHALRAAFFSQLPEPARKQEMQAELQWLQQAMIAGGDRRGMYTYSKPMESGSEANFRPTNGDFSNSQYGVLAVWYAALAGMEVRGDYWSTVEKAWREGQNPDGGWGYLMNDNQSYASMTAAGAATMYITYDYLHSREEMSLPTLHATTPPHRAALDKAMQWLGQHFAVDYNAGYDNPEQLGITNRDDLTNIMGPRPTVRMIGSWVHYMLFGYERVGEATGLTRFGTHRWFEEGAEFLMEVQNPDGSWNGSSWNGIVEQERVVGSAYALLFLSRGRSPVALQKLEFKGRWDNRSRDAASIARWLTHETERHTNWQIVPVETSAAEFRQAPILYVASDQPLVLSDSDKARIKTFIDQGGLLLAVNESRNMSTTAPSGAPAHDFNQSIVDLAHDLYPAYEFRNLPQDHLIYSENFPVKNLPTTPRSLSNGLRELIMLFPTGDMSWKFQLGPGTNNPALAPSFAFLGNLYIYLNDKANPRFKGDDTWVDADPKTQDQTTINIARLKINANWNPEPLAWSRFANFLHNADSAKLDVKEIDLSMMSLQSMAMAHLTATNSFELSDVQQHALRDYLDNGGLLVFDAAGGSTSAQISFETLMDKLYPGQKFTPLPIDHAIYAGKDFNGTEIKQVTYRRYAMEHIPKTTLPRLRALTIKGKIVAIDSPEDLTAGLVGYNIDGIIGYSPASSTELMRNIVLWANSQQRNH
jgi:hypothetical protein